MNKISETSKNVCKSKRASWRSGKNNSKGKEERIGGISKSNPLYSIRDNFKDYVRDYDESTADDDLNDFMSTSMGDAGVFMSEDLDIELMSNSDLDVDEIVKIGMVDSEELDAELDDFSGISEKEQMKEDVAEMEKRETICLSWMWFH